MGRREGRSAPLRRATLPRVRVRPAPQADGVVAERVRDPAHGVGAPPKRVAAAAAPAADPAPPELLEPALPAAAALG